MRGVQAFEAYVEAGSLPSDELHSGGAEYGNASETFG